VLTFSRFKLEEHPNCTSDYLEIHDGYSWSSSRLIGRYCGASLPNGGSVNTTHYFATLVFHADNSVNRDGFALSWVSVRPGQPLRCFYFLMFSTAMLTRDIDPLMGTGNYSAHQII